MRGVLLALALLLLSGCSSSGPATYPVTGTATFDGVPIADGDILFVPEDPKLRREGGKIIEGKFSFPATAGKKRVEIRASRPDPVLKNPKGEAVPVDYIPDEYNSKTTLSAEVAPAGPNEFSFKLESR